MNIDIISLSVLSALSLYSRPVKYTCQVFGDGRKSNNQSGKKCVWHEMKETSRVVLPNCFAESDPHKRR